MPWVRVVKVNLIETELFMTTSITQLKLNFKLT
jgi:hypothetical protein